MDAYEPFLSLGLALAAGLLIGLEREQSAPSEPGAAFFLGGARTHPLVALAAGLATLLARQLGTITVIAAFGGLVVFLAIAYADLVRRDAGRGFTSEAAFLVSFLLGALAVSDRIVVPTGRRVLVVLATAVVATGLLSSRPVLQPLVRRASRQDVVAALKFLIVAVVLVPLLPDQPFGPYHALNLRTIGWMMLLVTGVSFVGYAATRLLGPERGLGVTGLVGGLVSSTAVTVAMARRAREEPGVARPAALAVVLASSIVFLRVEVVVALVNADLAVKLAAPMVAMAVAGLAGSLLIRGKGAMRGATAVVKLRNPVSLSAAFEFALVFAVVLVAARAASSLGAGGVYLAALAAGTTDMDAISLSMGELAHGQVALPVAATAVFLAGVMNTVVKGIAAVVLGGWAFARYVVLAFGGILAAGAASLLVVWR
ncbi:MAG TPA: DUF4010 domain-containing protein [Anaeromyxobacteraceae bacterium]|nr:DUF4010 domain-containing protein [Anaeromyxobacteraceae bacterium]